MARKKAVRRGSKTKFKKCIIAKIRGTKISTPKMAQRAFSAAAKKCGHLLSGAPVRHQKRRTKRKRKYTRRLNRGYSAGNYSRYNLPF